MYFLPLPQGHGALRPGSPGQQTRRQNRKAAAAGLQHPGGLQCWPHIAQTCRLERTVTRKGRTSREVSYAVTSLSSQQADPQQLLALWRGHWGIENRVHWVRDVTFDEDRCQVRIGAAPQVMAALRNLSISLLRLAGKANIAAALRRHASHPDEALALVGA